MFNRSSLVLLLLVSSAVAVEAQYNTPGKVQSNSQARSQATCPWLSLGSAEKVIGGDASVSVNVSNSGEGACKFSRQQVAGDLNSLEIIVSKVRLSACPAGSTTLTGIGNEAAACRHRGSHGETAEMVSSRVRDLYFTVTLTSPLQKAATKPSGEQDDSLEQIAEQIAGNLF